MVSQSARSAVATAWLATEHQQLMYLLSPEGKTVFYIPGVEVVHTVSTPINLPDEKVSVSAFTGVQLCTGAVSCAAQAAAGNLGARPASAAALVYAIAASSPSHQPAQLSTTDKTTLGTAAPPSIDPTLT